MAAGVEPSISWSAAQNSSNWANHRFERITRCKLTIISESAVCKKFLGQIWSYAASLQISDSHSLECYVVIFCLYQRFQRIFLSFLWFILMNAQMSTQLLKNSFKSMSCLHRIQQFPRNFLCWQAPVCIQLFFQLYGANAARKTVQSTFLTFLHGFGIIYTKLLIIFIMLSAIVIALPRLPQ